PEPPSPSLRRLDPARKPRVLRQACRRDRRAPPSGAAPGAVRACVLCANPNGPFLARTAPAGRAHPGAPSRARGSHPGRALRRSRRRRLVDPERAPRGGTGEGHGVARHLARPRSHRAPRHARARAQGRKDRGLPVTALRVLEKDLKLHARDARFLATLALFSLSLVLILSVAFGPFFRDPAREASATLWAALFFAGVLGLTRTLDLESESGGGEALRLTGADPFAIYAGKTIANFLLMAVLFFLLLPCAAVFFDVGNLEVFPTVVGVAALTLIGYAAWGTLFAALARGLRARELLLSILLFPTLIPLWIG